MADIFLSLNVYGDVLALLVLIYLISKFAFANKRKVKSKLAERYEAMKRDSIFRKSLVILGISFVFSLLSIIFTIFYFDRSVINSMQAGSNIFRIIFFIYLFYKMWHL